VFLRENETELLHQIDYGIFLWAFGWCSFLVYIFLFDEGGNFGTYTAGIPARIED